MKITIQQPQVSSSSTVEAYFDEPIHPVVDGPVFRIAGWFVSTRELDDGLVIRVGSQNIGSIRMGKRADVGDKLGTHSTLKAYGFDDFINALWLTRSFCFTAWAITTDGVEIPIFFAEGRIERPEEDIARVAQPLYVVSMGRSGSTLLMNVLRSMHGIVASATYPQEFMQSIWLARSVAQMATTANHEVHSQEDLWAPAKPVGPSPFLHPAYMDQSEIAAYANNAFEVGRTSALEIARRAYRSNGISSSTWFAEKCQPTAIVNLLNWVYAYSRFIFLTRHPADVFLSRVDFRARRGDTTFAFEGSKSDPFGLNALKDDTDNMLLLIEQLPSEKVLIVKYENLIADRTMEIQRIRSFLNLPTNSNFDADVANPEDAGQHRTSMQNDGVDRWRSQLPADLLFAIRSSCQAFADRFGYSLRR
ncbi:sulfotransferase [Sphingobium sp. SA916]|uniref:sulfotransferase family protein n=1 Tax=Sphingobium sp. SA916 TaxID=1851207 RepID=UPI0015586F66|nr:sulfotransferase [Sphingobium sp. SA916]